MKQFSKIIGCLILSDLLIIENLSLKVLISFLRNKNFFFAPIFFLNCAKILIIDEI